MKSIDELVGLMRGANISRLEVGDSGITGWHADGSILTFDDRISQSQLRALLMEAMPQDEVEAAGTEGSGAFQLPLADGVLWMRVSPDGGPLFLDLETPEVAADKEEAPPPALSSEPLETPEQETVHDARPPELPFMPGATPRSRVLSESQIKSYSAAVGVILGAGSSLAAYLFFGGNPLVKHLFSSYSGQALVPVAISVLFFWGLAICCLRWLRIRELEGITSQSILQERTKDLRSKSLSEMDSAFETSSTIANPLLKRAQGVVRQWAIRPSLQEVAILLDHHAASDEETVRHAYGILRTFVWALPVLGLIGTVVGIAFAVGDFAGFLGGNVNDVGIIKDGLINVTRGLSYAFTITLQGLLAALLLVLPTSALQAREERLYGNIQKAISAILLPVLQCDFPGAGISDHGDAQTAFRNALEEAAKSVLSRVTKACSHIVKHIATETVGWVNTVEGAIEERAKSFGALLDKLGKNLEISTDAILMRLGLIIKSFEEQASALRTLIEGQATSNSQIQKDLVDAIGKLQTTAITITGNLSGLAGTTEAALEAQRVLQISIDKLAESGLDASINSVAGELSKLSAETTSILSAVNGLVSTTGAALEAQGALQTAINRLTESGLDQNLITMVEGLGKLSAETASVLEAVKGFAGVTGVALQAQEALQSSIDKVTQAGIAVSMEAVATQLSGLATQTTSATDAVKGLSGTTEKVLTSQQSLQEAIAQLHRMELPKTLADFAGALRQVSGVLVRFQEPIVFQAVRVSQVMDATDTPPHPERHPELGS